MAWTKAQTAIVAGVVVLLAAGTTTVTVKEIQKNKKYSWEVTKASFDVLYKTPPQVVIIPTKFSENGGAVGSNDRVLGIAQPIQEVVQAAYMKGRSRTVFLFGIARRQIRLYRQFAGRRRFGTSIAGRIKKKISYNWKA